MSIKTLLLLVLVSTANIAHANRERRCAHESFSLYDLKQRSAVSDTDILTSTLFCNQATSGFLFQKALDPEAAVKTAYRIFELTSMDSDESTRLLQTYAACLLAEQGDSKWARVLSKQRGEGMYLAPCMAKGGDFSEASERLRFINLNRVAFIDAASLTQSDLPFFSNASGVRREFTKILIDQLLKQQCAHRALDLLVGLRLDKPIIAEIEQFTQQKLNDPNLDVIQLAQTLSPFAADSESLIEPVSKCAAKKIKACRSMLKRLAYIVDGSSLDTMLEHRGKLNDVANVVSTSDGYRINLLMDKPIDAIWDFEVKTLSFEDRRRLILKLMDSVSGQKKIERIIALGLLPLDSDLRSLLAAKFKLKHIDVERNLFQQFAYRPTLFNLRTLVKSPSAVAFPWTTHIVLTGALKICKESPSKDIAIVSEQNVKSVNKALVAQLLLCVQ